MRNVFIFLLIFSAPTFGSKARAVYLSDSDMASIRLIPGRSTTLSFPIRPKEVVLGNQGSFGLERVQNDLVISPLQVNAHTNLFVYMEGRRFAFDLKAVAANGDEIILVRDSVEKPERGKYGK